MTDTSSLAITHSTTEPNPVAAHPLTSPAPLGTVPDSISPEDDEPYTIKCICAFQDDDGNTVFCERCETWQHIECYYHGREVPEVHNCTDCEPRPLDAKRATERQRRLREQSDGGDRKSKRSGTKSQKRKPKDHQPEAINGSSHYRCEPGVRDQPPTKKVKSSHHKASTSVSSSVSAAPPLLAPDPRKRSSSTANRPASPTKSLGPIIPLYSSEFLHLYEHDPGHVDMESSLFVDLNLATDLASWVRDPAVLSSIVPGRPVQEIFIRLDTLDTSQWPRLVKESITDRSVEVDGKHPTWKVLKTEAGVRKDDIVGEVKGKIGGLHKYCHDPGNRWQELRHPQPFVFFHPQLPIYIDSREEGTLLRYIRRSCRPNVTMKTFITNEVEYHFCFVANQDIPPDSEITAMWYLDPQLFGSSNGLVRQESGDAFQAAAPICISNVLAHFGGCACDPPQSCLLARVDRRRHPTTKQAEVRRKRVKTKPTVSPPGSGRSPHERAGSESVKNLEEDDQADSRSTSGSARGLTHSRDLTPSLPNSNHDFEPELSERDRRKIAAVEKKFEQLEHDQHATQRKKKRTSGQSMQTTPTTPSCKQGSYFVNSNSHAKSLHLDTAVIRQSPSPPFRQSPGLTSGLDHTSPQKVSGSNTPSMSSPPTRPHYVDATTQTDLDEHDVCDRSLSLQSLPLQGQFFIPLTQRLLKRCHQDRMKFNETAAPRDCLTSSAATTKIPSASASTDINGGLGEKAVGESLANGLEHTEITKTPPKFPPPEPGGVLNNPSFHLGPHTTLDRVVKSPVPCPWPSTAAHKNPVTGSGINGFRSSGLHVQLPPATTVLPMPLTTTPGTVTPLCSQSLNLDSPQTQQSVQIPGSSVTAPSPVKKKLSLGDYLSRRGTLTTPTSEKSPGQAMCMLPPQKSQSRSSQSSTILASPDDPLAVPPYTDGVKQEDSGSPDVLMRDAP